MRNLGIVLISIILIFCSIFRQVAEAQDIRIGLFENRLVITFTFHCIKGGYDVISPDRTITRMQPGNLMYISIINDTLSVHDGQINYGSFLSLVFKDHSETGEFSIKLIDPEESSRNYEGDLEVLVRNSAVQLINQLPFENYIAGVVETEGGSSEHPEFYKAQAVISRTFALKNWKKHESQGFNLCDDLHCQAYKGMNDQDMQIHESVRATHNLVLYDRNYKLITTPFHSNSGGETQLASDIWIAGEEYLQAVLDPFSEGQKNSRWTEKISGSAWRKYVFSKMRGDTSKISDESLLIKQEHRKKYFIVGKDTLLMAEIRKDMGFRSTFFNMETDGDSITVCGRGYGHGVGMSQEGAMEMANQGYSFYDILRFYYDNIEISDLSDLPDSEVEEVFR